MSDNIFKIALKYLHPLDVGFSINAYKSLPFFKKMELTPNDLTGMSIIFGLLSVIFLYRKNPYLASVCSIISYFFDTADGIYARKYNMVTQFGDYLDHISDIIQYIIYIGILVFKYDMLKHKWIIWVLMPLQLFGLSLYLGCIEKIYTKESSKTLAPLRKVCVIDHNKYVKILKYFSPINNLIILYIVTILLVK